MSQDGQQRQAQYARANATPFDGAALHVIASEAKQSPMPGVEIASSLRCSQWHTHDLPSNVSFALCNLSMILAAE
jgi:hypothetical protein